MRRYPGKNDLITLIVPIISNHTSELSKNEALSGYIWLLGEYPKYFSQLKQNLLDLIDGFLDYESLLQLNILTTIVKINLSIENQTYSNYLQKVLEMATKDCENADVRDKAYIYWRLLSSSSKESQKKIVLSKLPPIKTTIASFNPVVLEALVKELSTLASVYHKPSFTFIDPNLYSPLSSDQVTTRRSKSLNKDENIEDLTNLAKQEIINNSKNENLLDFDDDEVKPDNSSSNGSASLLDELNDLFSAPSMPSQAQPTQPVQSSTNDILDLFKTSAPQSSQQNQNLTQGIDNLNIDNTSSSSSNQNKLNNDLLDLF